MCYSALYDGRYWIFGATDSTMSAYSIDPLHSFDEEGYYLNECAYLLPDADEFPTWREVAESIRSTDTPWNTDDIEEELLYWQGDLDKPVNVE